MSTFTLHQGSAPLLVSCPHDGTALPDDIAARLTDKARRVPDTDWHVARLYAFARELGATVLVPRYSRYVIDLNRPPDDASLYPGQNTTGLCPLVGFDGEPIYRDGMAPDADEIADRRERFWRPYNEALAAELSRIRAEHGGALLWEAHSIRGVVPFLFDGPLPDLNLGTSAGASCSADRQARLEAVLQGQDDYDWVANGRFKGGYITRHFGDPQNGIDAVQLEISQRCYMDEDSFEYDEGKAADLQIVLRAALETCV
ncbi:MAG: N-formylglutamate deformylase [Xanthomonadales bacterium]|nr:N-formylglutamate deformylase [Xanthomonadales bacterium]